jgi:UDPglucose--hexose-1-phosphate uridylyltransferase
MSQLRKDPVVSRWVIVSTERARRPTQYKTEDDISFQEPCPFCEGNEVMTPPEIMAYRSEGFRPDGPSWNLRIVPNKFPALVGKQGLAEGHEGLYEFMSGAGRHEVIIETPKHEVNMIALSEKEFTDVLHAYRERILDLKADRSLRYVLIFKNQGCQAGATIEHIHSQLIALPIVPRAALDELEGAKSYFRNSHRCVYCSILDHESVEKTRVVLDHESFLVICPFAARFPFETWILPKSHSSFFEHASERQLLDLSRSLRETLIRISTKLNNPAFNYMIHSMPLDDSNEDYFHWHIEIIPKLTQVAGFEWGSGFYINPSTPEESAAILRSPAPS